MKLETRLYVSAKCTPASSALTQSYDMGGTPGKYIVMFDERMRSNPLCKSPPVPMRRHRRPHQEVTDNVGIDRWMEFPISLLLFLLVPGDPEVGAVYLLDRKKGT